MKQILMVFVAALCIDVAFGFNFLGFHSDRSPRAGTVIKKSKRMMFLVL